MTKKALLIIIGLVIFGILFAVGLNLVGISSSNVWNKDESISVVLTGFGSKNDKGVWEGEAGPILARMEKLSDVSDQIKMCQNGFEGNIYGNRVSVVISGMAKTRTAACLSDVFRHYGKQVKEVIVTGIGGITPEKEVNGDKTMIGDVCINSLAYDFDLQHYSSDTAGSESMPVFWSQKSDFVAQATRGDRNLAGELYQAALESSSPAVPENVREINLLYHQTSREPKVWGPDECMEITSDLYWHDIKSDTQARSLASRYMSEVYKKEVDSGSLVIITSMEAVPAGVLVDWWNKANGSSVAFAYVRGASNFDRGYLSSDKTPVLAGKENLEKLNNADLAPYAIQTSTLPVLKMFELRNSGIK